MQKVMGGEFGINEELLKEVTGDKLDIPYSSGRHALFTILNSENSLTGGGILSSSQIIFVIRL